MKPSTPLIAVSEGRTNNFDFLRFVLAASVILHHSYAVLFGSSSGEPISRLTRGQVGLGGIAVDCFFIISGFLITASWIRAPRLGAYLAKRIRRIYPAFVGMLLFCILLVGPAGSSAGFHYLRGIRPYDVLSSAAHLYMPNMPNVFVGMPAQSVNVSVWTIGYEFRCYLLVALLGLLGVFRYRTIILAVYAASVALVAAQQATGLPFLDGRSVRLIGLLEPWPPLLAAFLAGMVFYLYRDVIPYSRGTLVFALTGLFAAYWTPYLLTAILILIPYVLFHCAFSNRFNVRNFGRNGDYSYGVYLYAYPLQQLMVYRFGCRIPVAVMATTVLVGATLLAMLSWHLVEKRFLVRRRALVPVEPSLPIVEPPADTKATVA